ncbi:hypothetical protein ACE0DR_15365 [Azotobacter sp. CWF10]
MLISIVLTVVFACFSLFVAGLCLGRWMRPSSERTANVPHMNMRGVADHIR